MTGPSASTVPFRKEQIVQPGVCDKSALARCNATVMSQNLAGPIGSVVPKKTISLAQTSC